MESKDIYELLEIFPSKAPSLCHREDHTSAQYDSELSKCHHRSHEIPVKQCCAVNGRWISDVLEDVGNVLFPFHLLPERRKMSPSYTQSPTMLPPRAPTQTIHLC